MIGLSPTSGVLAAGDNSLGHLWNKHFKLSPRFIPCDCFPYPAEDVIQISAWNQSIAANIKGTLILFKSGDGPPQSLSVGLTRRIACTGDSVLCLLANGQIMDAISNEFYSGTDYKSFSASSSFVCARDSKNRAVFFSGGSRSDPLFLADQVITVGCTDSEIFVSTESALLRFENGEKTEVLAEATVIAIASSDTEALFLDFNGHLWHCELNTLVQIFGLPPIVVISAGPQHFAALSADGQLFTWGFNPSGQLGIGNDQATIYPSRVLSHVALVACGTHHTLAVQSTKRTPEVPDRFDSAKLGRTGKRSVERPAVRIPRAELLF
jgi:hypothetical protein